MINDVSSYDLRIVKKFLYNSFFFNKFVWFVKNKQETTMELSASQKGHGVYIKKDHLEGGMIGIDVSLSTPSKPKSRFLFSTGFLNEDLEFLKPYIKQIQDDLRNAELMVRDHIINLKAITVYLKMVKSIQSGRLAGAVNKHMKYRLKNDTLIIYNDNGVLFQCVKWKERQKLTEGVIVNIIRDDLLHLFLTQQFLIHENTKNSLVVSKEIIQSGLYDYL